MMKKICVILCMSLLLMGCAGKEEETPEAEEKTEQEAPSVEEEVQEDPEEAAPEPEEPLTEEQEIRPQTVVIDPGHSAVVAAGTEPLGPGSSEMKAADASGTAGVSTGVAEYELTLNVSMQLKAELENRGYTVLMTRESNDVPVSCVQRAEVANGIGAAAYVRIHANGSENQSAVGAMTICTTPQSPYAADLYAASRQLSDCIINKFCEATGCENDGVWETDTMSGNNWSRVPATIVEMGYMTNPEEDQRMQTPEYQSSMVQGIANGIDAFFGY